MRFPLIREFTASYRATSDRHEWLQLWHDASILIRDRNRWRVVGFGLSAVIAIVFALLAARLQGGLFFAAIAMVSLANAIVLGCRHNAEIDDLVLERIRKGPPIES